MHNSLRESFNANRSKLLLALAIIGVTNSALVENLNAQNSNNGGKAGTEMVDKSDAQRVADFTKPLGVTIPAEWIKFASDNIQMLDQDGIDVAHQLILADFAKIPQQDRLAYVLMAFDAIHTAYDKEKHTKASDEFFAEYITYENEVKSVTNRFAQDRQKRSETFIVQTQQENKQKAKESEEGLLKIYKIDPNNKKLKELALSTKKLFDEDGYKYSQQTAELFIKLGIK